MNPKSESIARARAFVEAVSRRIHVDAAYLGGSHARGDNRADSDFDIILVSPDFEKTKIHRRPPLLTGLWDHSVAGLDLFCYTPEEFETRRNAASIIADIMDYAVPII